MQDKVPCGDGAVSRSDQTSNQQQTPDVTPEKLEEMKLRSKFPNLRPGGASLMLQKRINNRPKFFDSGDYNMAKANGNKPGSLFPARQPALKVVVGNNTTDEPNDGSTSPTGAQIPTPETVSYRKSSIIQPEVASKLSPQPALHLHGNTGQASDNAITAE